MKLLSLAILLLSSLPALAQFGAQAVAAGRWEPRNYTNSLGVQLLFCSYWTDGILLNGETVSYWTNRLGNGFNISQGTEASQPKWTNDAPWGGYCLYFDGSNDSMATGAMPSMVQPTTVYMAVKPVTFTDTDTFFDGATLNSGRVYQSGDATAVGTKASTNSYITPGLLPLGQWSIIRQTFTTGGGTETRINRNPAFTSYGSASSMAGLQIGAAGNATLPANCEISTVIVCDKVHSDAEEEYILTGLEQMHGINAPYAAPAANELRFEIVYNAAATAPYITAATLADADVVWTRPDGTTLADKAPNAAWFNESGTYKVVAANWGAVTAMRFDQSSARDWLRRFEVGHILSLTAGLKTLQANDNSALRENISGWTLPASLVSFSAHGTQVSGDISGWTLPASLENFYVQSTQVSGDISGWTLPASLVYFYVNSTQVSGDISGWTLPASLVSFSAHGTQVSGDISGWTLPASLVTFSAYSTQVSGDISGWTLPASLVTFYVHSTQVDYGTGAALASTGAAASKNYRFSYIAATQAEVDRMLVDLDASGRAGPATFHYKGGNAAPSATGAAAWASLAGKGWTSD